MEYFFVIIVGILIGVAVMLFAFLPRIRQADRTLTRAEQTLADAHRIADANASEQARLADSNRALEVAKAEYTARRADFDAKIVSYDEITRENAVLKRDLQNIDVNLHKLKMDVELQKESQKKLDERSSALASRYLKENVKAISSAITTNNYPACKERLDGVIERVRDIGFTVSLTEELRLHADLKTEFELEVKKALAREEQARVREIAREEERVRREIERAREQAEREERMVREALEKALAEAHGQHSNEVERLKTQLAEAEAKGQRALSMAQQTKRGNVYVISNVGAFGENVFKVGMTRRLDPEDRIWELGDASVPFPFDIHMMIACDDAPSLENALHHALHKHRINKVNPRKEFFRVDLETVASIVKQHHGEIVYTAEPEALEYRQSLTMTDEDASFIESVFEKAGNTQPSGDDID